MLKSRLQPFINRYEEINNLLMAPDITNDIKRMTELSKEQSSIQPIVNKAKEYGLDAKRAYASNGLSLGKTEDVDLLIEDKSYQAKCRKTIGELYKPNKNVFGQIFKEDRGDTYIMLRFDDYLKLTKENRERRL